MKARARTRTGLEVVALCECGWWEREASMVHDGASFSQKLHYIFEEEREDERAREFELYWWYMRVTPQPGV